MKLVYIDDLPDVMKKQSNCAACTHSKLKIFCDLLCAEEAKANGFKDPLFYYYVDPLQLITLRLTT